MCGINGIFSKRKVENLNKRIKKMNKAISHRGPDSEGVYVNEKVGFGHRRLSILDIDKRSNQPFISIDKQYILVYNGEIFNFEEIKKHLNYDFKTKCDTEVVFASLIEKGIDWFLEIANGFFAFAFFDNTKNEIIICRDRFGIKPVFYFMDEEMIIFSSEIKGILNSGLMEPNFNLKAIDEYLGNRYVRSPFTFFENILSVEPSHYIKIDKTFKVFKKKYWSLPDFNTDKQFDENNIVKLCKEKIPKYLKEWFISDVKVGAYLSGGVDSSLTTAILSTQNKELDTYTIGFNEDGFNEFRYANQVAKQYKTNHREFYVTELDYKNKLEELIYFKDSPLGIPNEIPLAIMTEKLSKDITVVISGEGADELFGGYGKIFRLGYDESYLNYDAFYEKFISKYEYVPRYLRDRYLKHDNYREYFDEKNLEIFKSSHSKEESIFKFFHTNHIQGLLNRVDMTSMHTGIEARPPFLNHKLIEFAYTKIPVDLKLRWKNQKSEEEVIKYGLKADSYSEIYDTPKYILKKLAEDYLPENILYRKKMGFPVPLNNWFKEIENNAKEILTNAKWINNDVLENLFEDIKTDERSGHLLWMFINIEIFYSKYFNKTYKY